MKNQELKKHYKTDEGADPFQLFDNMESCGNCLIDFLRMDIIKRCFRLGSKGVEIDDAIKILDEAKRLLNEYAFNSDRFGEEIKRDVDAAVLKHHLENNIPF